MELFSSRGMVLRNIPWLFRVCGAGLVILAILAGQAAGQPRCVCLVDKDSWFFSFDLLKFKLPLPCTYRMTRLHTRTGCDMTVNLVMSQKDDDADTRPSGMTYVVREGRGMVSGTVSTRGIGVSDPQGFHDVFYPPSAMSMNGVEVFCYTDDLGFKSALFPSCSVSLHYQPNGYLGVYSRNTSDDFAFFSGYLCGNCDGGRSELRGMLGSDVMRQMRSWEDRTAAILYYTSLHIVGGGDQCKRHVHTMRRCPTRAAFRANQICGCILSPHSETGRCMRTRTKSRDRTLTYYACVQQYCSYGGSEQDGCDIIQQMLRKNACPLPRRFFC